MGFLSNLLKNNNREVLLKTVNAIKGRLNENLEYLAKRPPEEQVAVCIGAAKFEMVLMAKFGTIRKMMNAPQEEKDEWAKRVMAYLKTQEGDLLFWMGLDIGFAWYNAVDLNGQLKDQQVFVDEVRRVFEGFAKRGRGFDGIAAGAGFLDT